MSKEKFVLEKIFKVTVADENGEVTHIYDNPNDVGLPVADNNEEKLKEE